MNKNDNQAYNVNVGFTFTPSDKLIVDASGRLGITNIENSSPAAPNQNIRNNGVNASIKWNFIKKTYLETNLNYRNYSNDRFGFNQDIPIFNASIRRLFMKENKVEVRLAAFDIFNKNQSIVQQGSQNSVVNQRSLTLARYFMLSLTYNMKGHAEKLKKNQGWF